MRYMNAILPPRAALFFLCCAALCAGSCAQKGFPPGGPPDVTPPNVLYVYPDSGAVRVAVNSAVSITFDDKMDRETVESAFNITPPTDMESLNWDGKMLTVTPAKALVENRTYTILFASGMKDRRANQTKAPVIVHFSTGDSIAPGLVKGAAKTGGARPSRVMIWAYLAADCPPDLELTPAEGVGQADPKGEFFIGGLDTRESYCVYGHLDRDGDNELDDDDLFIGADSLVTFVPDSSIVSGLTIYLVPDDEPGEITGTVADSTGPGPADIEAIVLPRSRTVRVEQVTSYEIAKARAAVADSVRARAAEADSVNGAAAEGGPAPGVPRADTSSASLAEAAGLSPARLDSAASPAGADSLFRTVPVDTVALRRTIADSIYSAAKIIVLAIDVADSANFAQTEIAKEGTFTLKGLNPGVYRLEAFRDLNRDKTVTAGKEPVALLDNVAVKPGRTADAGALVLRRSAAKAEDVPRRESSEVKGK